MHLREATVDDGDALMGILERLVTSSAFTQDGPLDHDQLRRMLTQLLGHPWSLFAIAESDGEIVGLLAVVRAPHLYRATWRASELCWWVNPEDRRGVGVKLLAFVEAWAMRHGCDLEMLAPTSRYERALSRRGYVPGARVCERRVETCHS